VKHGRIISVKNPKLRKIRNNLRRLFVEVYRSEFNKLQKKIDGILRTSEDNLSSMDSNKLRKLSKQQDDLGLILKRSACICGMCRAHKEDMVWHAGWGEWWCLKCFKDEEEIIDPKNKFNKGVIVHENAEKPCHTLGWCPYGTLVESFRIRNLDSKYTCLVYDHDCPVFYLSQPISEHSTIKPIIDNKLNDNLRNCTCFNDQYIRFHNIEKPCHILGWCPYGTLGDDIYIRELDYKYGCKIFPHDCPVFYHAERLKEH